MKMTKLLALIAIVATVGCRRDTPDPPKVNVEVLPGITAKAGGEMVLLSAGSFTMGDSAGREDETPHPVSVGSFYIDKVPVTQELFTKVMGVNPSKRKDPKCPVEKTQWTVAVQFCNKCSEAEGLTPCYDVDTWECNFAANGYRLPTEAEWEYACRAGSTGKYCCGDDEKELLLYAWLKPGSLGKTQPVGTKLANRWGLFDMHGNVWQWCNDWYSPTYYKDSPKHNPRGPATGKERVLRGGAWDSTPEKCRAAFRQKEAPAFDDACFGADSYGFRRVRNAELKGTIVFVSDRSGSTKIWSMLANGKNAKQLTKSEGADADPRFSSDGKRILYTTLVGGFPEIWVMNRDGSNPQIVTKGSQGNWAPKADSIVFINDNQTFVRDLASGKEKLITPKTWERCGVPAFSPDGKSIAVASRHLASIGIFLVSLDGKENTQLKTEESCCTPCWSKDGKKILFQTIKGHIHEIGIDGKGEDPLTSGADVQHDARYSPDGTMILFCRAPNPNGPWQICVQRLDAGEGEFVTLTKEGSNQLPDWHADE